MDLGPWGLDLDYHFAEGLDSLEPGFGPWGLSQEPRVSGLGLRVWQELGLGASVLGLQPGAGALDLVLGPEATDGPWA